VSGVVLNDLRRKTEMFKQFDKKYSFLFSKGGFSGGLKTIAAQDKSIRLITLDEIYKR